MEQDEDGRRRAIEALHERYVLELIEGWNLCPFARRARLEGRVHRVLHDVPPGPPPLQAWASALGERVRAHPDLEIVLLTFPVDAGHPWLDPRVFEQLRRELYAAFVQETTPSFHMVCFHPAHALGPSTPRTPETLIRVLRRTPDPVIQCVRASVLDALHQDANARARQERFEEIERMFGGVLTDAMREVVFHSEMENALSHNIAHRNFEVAGQGDGYDAMCALLEELLEARRALDQDPSEQRDHGEGEEPEGDERL